METVLDGAFDIQDERDWIYDNVFGDAAGNGPLEEPVPENSLVLPDMIENQGIEPIMRMSCTRQSPLHIINAQDFRTSNESDREFTHTDVKPIWISAIASQPSIALNGDSISNGLKQCLGLNLFTGYAKINTIDLMKHSLFNGRLIATGSNNGDWNAVRNTHIYALRGDGRSVGHAFCIVGYNPTGWVAINSYGEENGCFTIPYDLTETLYTRYSVIDAKDELYVISYQQRIMDAINIPDAKSAMVNGWWSGLDPKKPITREECAAMVFRAFEDSKK